ncbi:hypothetical protein BCR32DRAFT_267433 [Anaeromyces robustus]|uniref:Uncharacterized protein n=1 Tax=Anaeromyces robustus TaxID=1754192 RepID=A0A1Y1XAD7_9FUNG|nr:hypothetical protein BCR32DRAFT_267433 [Anaeromyces robustus]|eukprot:ORX82715.1 hypothetical protein BCR32DRAFT_267433 [Anaeromyces robustus]
MLSSNLPLNDGDNSCNIYYQTVSTSTYIKKTLKYKNKDIKNKCIVIIKDHYIELYEILNNTKYLLRHSKNVFGTIYDAGIIQTKVNNSNNEIEYKDVIIILSDSGYLSVLEYKIYDKNENNYYIHDPLNEEKRISLSVINQFRISNYGFDYRNPTFFLRTDPLSRSICISSFVNNIYVWNIDRELSQNKFDVENSILLNENGTIIDLVYLYPFQDDLNKMTLVTLICSDEKIYIVIYNLDKSDNLTCKSNFKSVPFLDASQSMPIQIVALPKFPECFIVLTEHDIFFFKVNILMEQNIYCSKINLSQYMTHYLLSKDFLVTSAIPYDDFLGFRTKDMSLSDSQDLLLNTSQGSLLKLSIFSNNEIKIQNISNPVSISNPLYLDYFEGSDYFFSSGEMSNGYIFSINKRTNELNIHDKIPDFSLLTNCISMNSENSNSNININKLYVTCGYHPNGNIKMIENGIKTTLLSTKLALEGIIEFWTAKCKQEQYIIISLYYNTIILSLQKKYNQEENCEKIVNCDDICNFDLNCRTIYAGSILNNEYLIQITENKIKLIYNSEQFNTYEIVKEWNPGNNGKILKAEIIDNYIMLKYSNSKTIEIIQINKIDSYNLTVTSLKEFQLDNEISTMKLMIKNNNLYIYVVTYEPALYIYYFNIDMGFFDKIYTENLDAFSSDETGISNSIEILRFKNNKDYVIIGFRNGILLIYEMEYKNEKDVIIKNSYLKQLGNIPIKLCKNNFYNDNNQYIIILAESTYKLYATEYGISLMTIIIPKIENIAQYYHPESKNVYLIECNNSLQIVNIDKYKKIHTKEHNILGTPKHLIYDDNTKTLVVSSDLYSITNNVYSEISIINPLNGKVYFNESFKDKEEICTQLAKWNVKSEKNYICISMWNLKSNESCVSMYNIKKNKAKSQESVVTNIKTKVNLKNQMYFEKRGEIKISGKVSCIHTLLNKYLLISSDNVLYIIQINPSTKSPIISSSIKTRWKITTLNAYENYVYVGQVNESVSLYEFDRTKKILEFKKSDEISKLIGSCITLSKDSVFVADRYGSIFGLSNKKNMRYSLNEEFNFYFGEPIMKFIQKDLNNNQLHSYFNTTCNNENELINNEKLSIVYGLSILGTIIKMIQIPEILYKQFLILQLIMGMHKCTKPILGNEFDKYISKHRISHNIINGDMLKQFVLLNKHEQKEIVDTFNELWSYQNDNKINSDYTIEYFWNIIYDFDKSVV